MGPTATQWDAEPHQRLEIPVEILAGLRYKFTAYVPGRAPMQGRCASWDALEGGAIKLYRTLTDTSEQAMGVVLRQRMTWRPEIIITGCAVVVTGMNPEELERHPWTNADVAGEHRGHYACQLCGRGAADPIHGEGPA